MPPNPLEFRVAANQYLTQNQKMNKSPVPVFLFSTLLVIAAVAAEARQPESAAAAGIVKASADPQTTPSAPQGKETGLIWLTNLPQAQARAKAEGKSVLLFFHGSDWCPPCIEMQHQVLESPAFAQYARRALVLVDVDFPEKSSQNEGLMRANVALKSKFNLSQESVEGIPTIVLLNEAGETVFQETGYAGGGTAEVIPKLQHHTGTGAPPGDSDAFKNLSVAEFARMAEDKGNVILDVRTPEEFKAGHLAGAVNLDVNASDFQEKAALLDRNKIYLVHCASGVRSVRACDKLSHLDFPKLYNLPGGFRAWVKAGQPVER
jgi:phage shock protein E